MRRILKICLLLVWSVSCLSILNFAHASDYEYTNLDIYADVKIDGTIDVNETFTADFNVRKHGIIRSIPLNYTVEDTDFHIDLDYVRVDWNKFSTYREDGSLNIKIWDPDVEILWEKKYPIFYSVYWLVRNFSWLWYSELYWNLVWYDFDTNINKIRAEINLPKFYNWFTEEDFLITTDWNTTSVKEFDWSVDWSWWDKIVITYNKRLDIWEWITLAIKFPKDYFEFDHDKQASLLWYVKGWSNYVSNTSSLSDMLSDSDFMSTILTFVIFLIGMLLPGKWGGGGSYSSWWSYSRSSWFSSGSSFSWGFSRGWGWWWGGSKSW